MTRNVSPTTARDLRLVALTFSSGAVDAISFIALGKVFTAFMTGNIVFLGLGIGGTGVAPNVPRVCVALLVFASGVYLGARIVRAGRGQGAWPRHMSLVLGGTAAAQAGFLVLWIVVSGEPSTGAATALAALSAFAMGMQSAAVMSLGVAGVFTTAATATIMFLSKDTAEPPVPATDQRRLAGVIVALLAGATAGALLLDHARTLTAVLPFVVSTMVVANGAIAHRASRTGDRVAQAGTRRADKPIGAGEQTTSA